MLKRKTSVDFSTKLISDIFTGQFDGRWWTFGCVFSKSTYKMAKQNQWDDFSCFLI